MEKLRNPKNVKTISLIVAAIFVIGCFTLAMSAGGFCQNHIADCCGYFCHRLFYTGDERRRVWQRRGFRRVQ